MFGRLYRASRVIRYFRWPSAVALIFWRRDRRQRPGAGPSRIGTLRRRGCDQAPLYFRTRTSDAGVISQIIVDQEYAAILGLPGVRVIVDAGANVGATSAFLLDAYSDATVIAIEPDPGTFAMLERNLAHYGSRAVTLRAALWDRETSLAIARGHYRDGTACTFEARPGNGTDEEVESTTVPRLLERFALPRIDILKVDIERGERVVFGESARGWLERVRVIAVELHDAECRAAFEHAVAGIPADVIDDRDLTVWRRREVA